MNSTILSKEESEDLDLKENFFASEQFFFPFFPTTFFFSLIPKRLLNQKHNKTPLDWKTHLQDCNFITDALSFEKWDKNLYFDTAKFKFPFFV